MDRPAAPLRQTDRLYAAFLWGKQLTQPSSQPVGRSVGRSVRQAQLWLGTVKPVQLALGCVSSVAARPLPACTACLHACLL